MSLIVEDGTGMADAESYLSVADLKTYATNRGISYAGISDSTLEQKLRLATTYIDTRYRYRGNRSNGTQALEYPRINLIDWSGYDISGVPKRVKDATAELALKATADSLYVDLDRGGKIKSESVGQLSVTYADDAPAGRVFTIAENLLKPYVRDPSLRGVPFFGGSTDGYFTLGMMDAPNANSPTTE